MNTLSLIIVTVLVTLISGALVGFLIYLGVVVRKLRQTVKVQSEDITNLQNAVSSDLTAVNDRIDQLSDDLTTRGNQIMDDLERMINNVDKKVDSRYDKLLEKQALSITILEQEIERLRELIRKAK